MSRYNFVVKDKKIRRRNNKNFFFLKNMKMFFSQNKNLNSIQKLKCFYSSNFLKNLKNKSICKIRNRCIFTNRARGINSKFHVSRLQFKRLTSLGLLNGVRKSST